MLVGDAILFEYFSSKVITTEGVLSDKLVKGVTWEVAQGV